MNDCPNVEMRELLPDYAHGAESAGGRVAAHVATCADCAAELDLIRLVIRAAPRVPVDVQRVTAAIPAYRHRSILTRQWRIAAAAMLIATGGVSLAVLRGGGPPTGAVSAPAATLASGSASGSVGDQPEATGTLAGEAGGLPGATSLSMVGGLSELSDAQLIALTESVGDMDAMPDGEPPVLVDPIGDQP